MQALFNVMLREFGVKGVKVQEVISLDDEMLQFLKSVPAHFTMDRIGFLTLPQQTRLRIDISISLARR